jgi:hypothetical protein
MLDSAKGGDDKLTGGNNSGSGSVFNGLFGDATFMSDTTVGGKDTLTGGNNSGALSLSMMMRTADPA